MLYEKYNSPVFLLFAFFIPLRSSCQPKDIVAGDFYWFHKILPPTGGEDLGGTILIAAADCTGHGVPGAFTSMICSEKLNDAAKYSCDPGEILSLTNKGLKISLKQSEGTESTKDGMDIALCSIDIKTGMPFYQYGF